MQLVIEAYQYLETVYETSMTRKRVQEHVFEGRCGKFANFLNFVVVVFLFHYTFPLVLLFFISHAA